MADSQRADRATGFALREEGQRQAQRLKSQLESLASDLQSHASRQSPLTGSFSDFSGGLRALDAVIQAARRVSEQLGVPTDRPVDRQEP